MARKLASSTSTWMDVGFKIVCCINYLVTIMLLGYELWSVDLNKYPESIFVYFLLIRSSCPGEWNGSTEG